MFGMSHDHHQLFHKYTVHTPYHHPLQVDQVVQQVLVDQQLPVLHPVQQDLEVLFPPEEENQCTMS